jgi:hypothetical protein
MGRKKAENITGAHFLATSVMDWRKSTVLFSLHSLSAYTAPWLYPGDLISSSQQLSRVGGLLFPSFYRWGDWGTESSFTTGHAGSWWQSLASQLQKSLFHSLTTLPHRNGNLEEDKLPGWFLEGQCFSTIVPAGLIRGPVALEWTCLRLVRKWGFRDGTWLRPHCLWVSAGFSGCSCAHCQTLSQKPVDVQSSLLLGKVELMQYL